MSTQLLSIEPPSYDDMPNLYDHLDIKPWLFEVAWEVANRVGGIYTVLKTKAPVTVNEFGERYCLIGPLFKQFAQMEVEPRTPSSPIIQRSLEVMRSKGIEVMYGRWLIEGFPNVILFDLGSAWRWLPEWKEELRSKCQIPTPSDDTETDNAIVFGNLTAWFFGEYIHQCGKDSPIIVHFHEWLSAVGLLMLRERHLRVATVFTTHATLLGRYLCAGNVDFYNHMDRFDVDYEAGIRKIYHRYCIERGGAHGADIFTTVSHITAYEAEHLLKKRPDGVTPNGLNVIQFSAMHEFQNLHAKSKEIIHNFVRGHFYGHYDFELDKTLYFFTAGRYEYSNKGVDMFIESLYRLNQKLKRENSDITVIVFIIMPAKTQNFTVEALKGQAVTKQLGDIVSELQDRIGCRIFEQAARGQLPNTAALLSEQETVILKRRILALKRDSLPPIVTHNMAEDANDPILNHLRRVQLFNRPSDRVKVIFHPEFLSSNSPLLPLDYDDFVRGCHLGVFPSYYEPWGYTPAECTVMGVPSITTNLSGFGCFVEEHLENPNYNGIFIVDRRLKSIDESIEQLSDYMLQFCQKSRRQRISLRNRTERLSEMLDWKRMGLEYMKARTLALKYVFPEFSRGLNISHLETLTSRQPITASAPASPNSSRRAHTGSSQSVSEDESSLDAQAQIMNDGNDDESQCEIDFLPKSKQSKQSNRMYNFEP